MLITKKASLIIEHTVSECERSIVKNEHFVSCVSASFVLIKLVTIFLSPLYPCTDHIREFSCGKLYYRTLHLDVTHETLYVGAMDKVFKINNLNNINRTRCESDSITLDPGNLSSCISKGKSSSYDCRNHIRVIQSIGGNKVYICGTNAYSPKDWVLHSNLTHLPDVYPGVGGSAVAKCPFDPEDNSTAIWVEKGNPGGLPGLWSGSVADLTKADSVIFRTDLYNNSGQKVHPFTRTIKYDSKWLDSKC